MPHRIRPARRIVNSPGQGVEPGSGNKRNPSRLNLIEGGCRIALGAAAREFALPPRREPAKEAQLAWTFKSLALKSPSGATCYFIWLASL
jgi:hypothetical protein